MAGTELRIAVFPLPVEHRSSLTTCGTVGSNRYGEKPCGDAAGGSAYANCWGSLQKTTLSSGEPGRAERLPGNRAAVIRNLDCLVLSGLPDPLQKLLFASDHGVRLAGIRDRPAAELRCFCCRTLQNQLRPGRVNRQAEPMRNPVQDKFRIVIGQDDPSDIAFIGYLRRRGRPGDARCGSVRLRLWCRGRPRGSFPSVTPSLSEVWSGHGHPFLARKSRPDGAMISTSFPNTETRWQVPEASLFSAGSG